MPVKSWELPKTGQLAGNSNLIKTLTKRKLYQHFGNLVVLEGKAHKGKNI